MRHSTQRSLHRKALTRSAPLALVAVAVTAAVAQAAITIGPTTSFRARFTTPHPGAASGLVLKTTGRPPASGTSEAPAVQQTVILPAGTTLKLVHLPQCQATDTAIATQGAETACPHASRVGSGGADGVFDGAHVHFDIAIYAVRRHLVFAAERGGQPLKMSFAGFASGRRLILTVPTLGGRIAPTEFDARITARPGHRSWLQTPARCPRSGHWTATGRFQGVSDLTPNATPVTPAQTATDDMPCTATRHPHP